ncbi:hypothetical protein BCV72DRAFT_203178 [Rhizopus microsporus var. microsporus]|uniref:Uncharacterized protein n=1 Tax=Rhizopus microsporus var. microsporus TaxID=86635 RepID=A0A1X0R9E6_RHIZD|nr:hypothetical protein BCV72DRAFT_203178 [Rhizopus microsporus var. microsporus]
MIAQTISDPLSFLLNTLPTRKYRFPNITLAWTIHWPTICRILYELDYLYHAKLPSTPPTYLGQRLRMASLFSFSLAYFIPDPKRVFLVTTILPF